MRKYFFDVLFRGLLFSSLVRQPPSKDAGSVPWKICPACPVFLSFWGLPALLRPRSFRPLLVVVVVRSPAFGWSSSSAFLSLASPARQGSLFASPPAQRSSPVLQRECMERVFSPPCSSESGGKQCLFVSMVICHLLVPPAFLFGPDSILISSHLRRQTTDKKILSGKKGVFYSP